MEGGRLNMLFSSSEVDSGFGGEGDEVERTRSAGTRYVVEVCAGSRQAPPWMRL